MSKDDYARVRFFVNEEHPLAKPVRCGSEAALGVHILRPTLFELLVCVGKLAGRECLTSAGVTTTLVVTARSPSLARAPPTTPTNFVEAAPGTQVKKTASVRSMVQREVHPSSCLT